MKKLTTIIAGLFLFFSASAFNVPDADVTVKIKTVFEKDFIAASNVKWQNLEGIYVASFKEKDNYLTAAYSEEGELLSIGRYVELSQLPLNVTRALENRYAGYKIDSKVVELSAGTTSYFIYAENGKFKLKIKSDTSGNLSVESKTKK